MFKRRGRPIKSKSSGMKGSRKWGLGIVAAVVAVAAVSIPVGFANADTSADSKPSFLSPFKCGKQFYANNWSGHNPPNSIDWQSYNGDSTYKEPVKASAAGTVSKVKDLGGSSYGKYVVINHKGGWQTLYAHLYSFKVKVNQKVSAGSTIAVSGKSGGVPAHLHYEQIHGSTKSPVVQGISVPTGPKKLIKSKNCGGGGSGNPYTASDVCGGSYKQIDSASLKSKGKKVGSVVLTYSSSTGKNCVATMKETSIGKKSAASASLTVKGKKGATNSGKFSYYAGPVKKAAKSTCVKWSGAVGSAKYTSKYEHCS